jgi:hypothetical protein
VVNGCNGVQKYDASIATNGDKTGAGVLIEIIFYLRQ